MFVTKVDGSKQQYSRNKLLRTCMRSGLPRKEALIVVKRIESKLYDGIPTRNILRLTLTELDKKDMSFSARYSLRKALSELNPKNNEFERFVELLLKENGFKTQWNVIVKGKTVEHQLDIIAEKGKTYLIEIKHHRNPHRFCGLGVVLQNWARILDIRDATKKYDYIWIITNTKFSNHAIRFARAKKIFLTGWRFPVNKGLETWVDKKSMYPVTVLRTTKNVKNKLLLNNILQIKQMIMEKDKLLKILSKKTVNNILNQAERLCEDV